MADPTVPPVGYMEIHVGGNPVSASNPFPTTAESVGAKQAVTIADGDNVSQGSTTDAAVVTDSNGTQVGFLRGLVKILADVWSSASHYLKVQLQAGTAIVGKFGIDQTTPGTTNYVEAHTYIVRTAGVVHRSAITAIDKLAVPATPTLANNAGDTAGALVFNTAYNFTLAAGNRWGDTTVPTVGSVTTPADAVSTHTVRATFATVAGADFYDVFLSTGANPAWVARITEAQRAAGGWTVTAVGTVTQVGSAPAGSVDIRVVGTGLASNVAPYTVNNAYTPAAVGITPVNCVTESVIHLLVKLSVTDLRSIPTLALAVFIQDSNSAGDWMQTNAPTTSFLTTVRQPLEQEVSITVAGAAAVVVLVDTITGQGAAVTITQQQR